jgi:hypothetical protein
MSTVTPGRASGVGDSEEPQAISLTATVTWAADGWFELHVLQMPDLVVHSPSLDEAPAAVQDAAAHKTKRKPDDFDVELIF